MKAVTDFISPGRKITADSDYSCGKKKKKKTIGPWKKSYEKPWQHTNRQRHYFTSKGLYSQSYGFSRSHEWMWELDHKESWAPKNSCIWTVCWTRLLRVPWTARRSNQSILKEISLQCSLERLMLKLKLQYFGPPDAKNWLIENKPWCWARLKAGRGGDDRGWDGWMASPTWWTWVWASSGSWWWTGRPSMLQSMGL